ncbi:hypothetical protein F5884DRAFT_850931 [Xylogone sp. PMI_703]|nr:hypothetical protein F5884DRAFT_850931 [Xylogone sp. PMI_703]
MPREVSPPRRPLHERSNSSTNARAGIRLVPNTPPRPAGTSDDDIYSRTPLPTHPSHILSPGKVGQGSAMDIGVSRVLRSPASTGSVESSVSTQSQTSSNNNSATNSGASTPRKTRPRSRSHRRIVTVHPDKTFSLVERDDSETLDKEQKSPTPSLSSQSSYGALPSNASNTPPHQRTSSLSCITDTTLTGSAAPTTPSLGSKKVISADPIANSPWNYKLVGGIRKVPTSPNEKQAGPSTEINSESEVPEPTSPLGSVAEQFDQLGSSTDLGGNLSSKVSTDLSTKPSFQSTYTATTISENVKIYPISSRTESTISENPNYRVYPLLSRLDSNVSESPNYKVHSLRSRSDSDASPASPASGNSNYEIHARSSVAPSVTGSVAGTVIYRPRAGTESEVGSANFPDSSPTHSTYDSPSLQPRPKYSQESLVVPPLNPKSVRSRRSSENFGYYKSRSRESLRTTGSLGSISTVISQQEASRAVSATPSVIEVPTVKPVKPLNLQAEASSSAAVQRMEETPHQWSSKLSTVPSVSEETSERGSGYWSERRSSGFASNPSRHSTQILSLSSSLALDDISSRLETATPDALTRPSAAFHRSGQRHQSVSSAHLMADPDEHGDTITDMQDLRSYSSRNRLSALYASSTPLIEGRGRSDSMRSNSSSRSNSVARQNLPAWAKIYYGSGERKYLSTPGGSSSSGDESRPSSSFHSRSPSIELPSNLWNPRRRPREVDQKQRESTISSLDITPAPPSAHPSVRPSVQPSEEARAFPNRRYPGFKTFSMSSIWSPHLRLDKRTMRQHVWERPPSMTWSTEGGWFGRRNVQILLFVFGFLCPVAWIVASFLPLPRNPLLKLQAEGPSEADISNDYDVVFGPMDEARYESARWWRIMNRWMSVIGVLVIITIIVLAVLGTTQGL